MFVYFAMCLCRDFVNFTTCLRDSWNASFCGSATDAAWKNDTLLSSIEKKYFPDCLALQKGTKACNRQKFVNDIFLCGLHFSNIMEVARKNSSINPCTHIEKYKKCYNASMETYGCAPTDQLHKDAEKFFEFMTQKYKEQCKSDSKSPSVARMSRLTQKDDWMNAAQVVTQREISTKPRLPNRGGWAVAERCRYPLDVLVFVHASAYRWRRRATVRDTLLEEASARRFSMAGVFFVGRRFNDSELDAWLDLEADMTGDLVVLPIEDGYRSVTPKFLAGMRWVADHCPTVKWIVKIDDDVMVEPFEVPYHRY
ncbi:hypothetical protein V5799_002765 [Amblyomma americanum]|uniref:Hexosyltransferase n=1 Tax=Amblyomma americanum TaxID=6943 RepID=A0AAQ4DAW1_AMBAM